MAGLLKRRAMSSAYVTFPMRLARLFTLHGILDTEMLPQLYFGKKWVANCEL